MTDAQRQSLIDMMNVITRIPWCSPDLRLRAATLLAGLIPDYGFASIFRDIFNAGSIRQ